MEQCKQARPGEIKRPVTFEWTDDRVAEVSRIIFTERDESPVWTADYGAEKSIIRRFKLQTIVNQKLEEMASEVGIGDNVVVVNKDKLNELVRYLSDYQAELQSL